jgi:peptidoglycan/xylan/chitin deacetylase (PgdA/CDA1 family)
MSEKLKARVVTFLYHEVTDDPSTSGFQRKSALPYKHRVSEFEENLNEIAKSPIPISLVNNVDLTASQKHILLTFDDGGKSSISIADAIEKRGWKGHFFVTTSMIGTSTFLSKKEIHELHQRGHIIGSHSHNHPDVFYNLSYDEMIKEWRVSLDVLTDIIQEDVVCASIPGGEMNLNAQLSAQEVGSNFLFTSEPTLVPWKLDNIVCFGRVCPKKGTALTKVSEFANHRGLLKELAIRKVKNTIKKVYYQVRKVINE